MNLDEVLRDCDADEILLAHEPDSIVHPAYVAQCERAHFALACRPSLARSVDQRRELVTEICSHAGTDEPRARRPKTFPTESLIQSSMPRGSAPCDKVASLIEVIELLLACLPGSQHDDESWRYSWEELGDDAQEEIIETRRVARNIVSESQNTRDQNTRDQDKKGK